MYKASAFVSENANTNNGSCVAVIEDADPTFNYNANANKIMAHVLSKYSVQTQQHLVQF